jgi:dTMP kinase
VFEGPWGSGKSVQTKRLYKYLQERFPNKKIFWTREPGGTEIAEKIRRTVQGTKYTEKMAPITDVYLYAASRAQSLRSVVKPVLEEGGIVIGDRSFVSSLVLQGYAQGYGIKETLEINQFAIEGIIPDYIFYLDISVTESRKRTFDGDGDKFEKATVNFAQKTEEGYRKVARIKMFKDKWVNIDGSGTKKEVFVRVKSEIDKIIN